MKRLIPAFVFAAALMAATSAQAVSYQYTCSPCSGNHAAGEMVSLDTTFNTVTDQFRWTAEFSATAGNLPSAGWLVVSDGPNPKSHVNEYAIMYLDHASGDVTAYVYNGLNSANSYQDAAGYLGTFSNAITVSTLGNGNQQVSLSLDATGINNAFNTPDWDGISFDKGLGYWYHPSTGNLAYNGDGTISGFNVRTQGWYDKRDLQTRPIPEPSAALVFGIGALLVGASRKHRRA